MVVDTVLTNRYVITSAISRRVILAIRLPSYGRRVEEDVHVREIRWLINYCVLSLSLPPPPPYFFGGAQKLSDTVSRPATHATLLSTTTFTFTRRVSQQANMHDFHGMVTIYIVHNASQVLR
jgi:hypothetical protein